MRIHRPKITSRKVAIIVGAWTAVILVSLIVTAFQLRWWNLRELKEPFARWETPGKGRRIVVFAPHCDDETLGTGGLLRQAAAEGADVWVVLMTNGDGSRYSATVDSRALLIRPGYYVNMGYRRQRETSAALKKLGINRIRVITLGYPDKGLEPMWVSHWRAPYVSPYTRDSSSPYGNSFTPSAAYTGEQLLTDLKKLLREVDPTDIYFPHPNDQHPDHWATSAFVTEAIYDLGWQGKKNVGLYLVHRGDWPVPQGLHEKTHLAPPAALAKLDTRWYQCPLEADSVRAKGLAVEEFRSQPGAIRRFLRSFVRQNELFGTRSAEVRVEKSAQMRVDGKTDDWDGIGPVIRDPVADGLPAVSQPGADLVAVYAARDWHRLYFRIAIRGAISSTVSCDLRVHPLGTSSGTASIVLKRGKRPPVGWQVAFGKRDIELSCPLDRWQRSPLLVTISTKARWYPIDRSAYRILLR